MEASLAIFRPDGSRKDVPLKPGRYLVGRRADAQLRIPLPDVSRQHCEIVNDGSRLVLRDLGSANGTFRNDRKVSEAALEAGDVLSVGGFLMTVVIDGVPAAPPRPVPRIEVELDETPPVGTNTVGASPGARAGADPDATVASRSAPPGSKPLTGKTGDDSSIFDFDFDFESDENPKL